jgi:hypothetical protein
MVGTGHSYVKEEITVCIVARVATGSFAWASPTGVTAATPEELPGRQMREC